MSANTETTGGPPKGYVECPKKCGRWYAPAGPGHVALCNRCHAESCLRPGWVPDLDRDFGPDWSPPIAPPEPLTARDVFGEIPPGGKLTNDTPVKFASAPPEPLKSCVCPHGPHATDGKCPIHVTAGMESSGFQGCACAKCVPPAQEAPNLLNAVVKVMDAHYRRPGIEAPKAAPVCSECDHAQPNVCMRVTREARELLCDICMTRKEEQVIDLMGQEPRAVPYKGPTRLPRPQLAADWVEDCLGDVR